MAQDGGGGGGYKGGSGGANAGGGSGGGSFVNGKRLSLTKKSTSTTTSPKSGSISYVLSTTSSPVHVTVTQLTAERTNAGVRLNWETAAERSCGAFSLRRCVGDDCESAARHTVVRMAAVPRRTYRRRLRHRQGSLQRHGRRGTPQSALAFFRARILYDVAEYQAKAEACLAALMG